MKFINFNFSFKRRSCSFYLTMMAVAFSLLGGLVFFIIDKTVFAGKTNFTDHTDLTFTFLLLGAVIGFLCMFTELSYLNIISALLTSSGIGMHLYLTMFPLGDVITKVPFFVSDQLSYTMVANIFLLFLAIFILADILFVISCFLFKKSGKEQIKARC